jgi:AcrR family transcriptional regulator
MSELDEIPQNRFQRRKEITRSLLKRAAGELILEKGYDEVTIEDITERADVGRGTFYIHFKDKEDLLWNLMKDEILVVDRELNAWFERERPEQGEYYGYLATFRLASKNRDLYRIMLGGKGSANLTARLYDYLDGEIEKEIRARRFFQGEAAPAEILARYLTGALIHLLVWWVETPNDYTAEQMAEMAYRLIHHRPPVDQPLGSS